MTEGRPKVLTTTALFVVSDLQRAIDFYCEKLGFRGLGTWGEPPCFAILDRDGFELMLSVATAPDRVRPNGSDGVWDLYVAVGDVEAEAAALRSAGLELAREPERTEYHMIEIEVLDPDGHRICFGQDVSA